MSNYKCKNCGREISKYEHDYQDDICFLCHKERYYDDLTQLLRENEEIETDFEDEIVCPYCGNRMQDDEGYFAQQGDGEYECDECGKTFNFTANIEVTYSTSRKEDEE